MQYLKCGRKFGLAVAAGTTMFVVGSAMAQEVVYDNTATPLGTLTGQITAGQTTGYEAGDQITLGGVGRTITQIVVNPYNLDVANSGTAQIRFYDTPGAGANPGVSTVLWDSGPVAMAFPAGQESLTFAVPNIVVPSTFVWTATYVLNTPLAAGTAFGNRIYNPPTVGTSGDFFWANNAPGFPGWATLFYNGSPVANYGCTVTAQLVVVNGACCKPDGTCSDGTNTACAAIPGAVFQGSATTCGATTCPLAGACCVSGGACSPVTATFCASQAGVFAGEGIACAAANCPKQYFYDDGIAENAIGSTNAGGAAYFNQFASVAGAERVTQIQIAFGTPQSIDGSPVTAYILSDPNQDGSPADAQVLAQVPGTIVGANAAVPINTPTWVIFDIPDTTIAAGTKFFAGFVFQNEPAGVFPGAVDSNAPQGKSWFGYTAGTFDPNAFAGAIEISTVAGLGGNWLIRADAVGAGPTCYANCDASTGNPFLNVGDFTCFLQKFAAASPYANCDSSTGIPQLNVGDFTCFLQKFAAGCSAP